MLLLQWQLLGLSIFGISILADNNSCLREPLNDNNKKKRVDFKVNHIPAYFNSAVVVDVTPTKKQFMTDLLNNDSIQYNIL